MSFTDDAYVRFADAINKEHLSDPEKQQAVVNKLLEVAENDPQRVMLYTMSSDPISATWRLVTPCEDVWWDTYIKPLDFGKLSWVRAGLFVMDGALVQAGTLELQELLLLACA